MIPLVGDQTGAFRIEKDFQFEKINWHLRRRNLKDKLAPTAAKEAEIEKLIGRENTHTTQFSRIMELQFYANCLYRSFLKNYIKYGQPVILTDRDKEKIIDYIFCMFSIIRILKIYGTDYLMGESFVADKHFKIATLFKAICKNDITGEFMKQVIDTLENVFGEKIFGSFDHAFHFNMAKTSFEKVILLHTTGTVYKKAVSEMIYLEDDFNDNAYHFGAAFDRYMMINGFFKTMIEKCESELR